MPGRQISAQTRATSTERLYFGPSKMGLPASFEGTVTYSGGEVPPAGQADSPLKVTIRATFDGQRVSAMLVGIERTDGTGVTPRDLTMVELGAAIEAVTAGAVSPDHGAHIAPRPGRRPTPDELELVADAYWYHHVIGGNPRQAVMDIWDLPKSTANGWLRKAKALYQFPEA